MTADHNRAYKHPRAASPLLALALLLAAAGCGEWEVYNPNTDGGGSQGGLPDYPKVTTLQHLAQGGLLARHVQTTSDGFFTLVNYDGLAQSGEASHLLSYCRSVTATVNASDLQDEKQRLAYWINGYNASVIAGVLANYNGDHNFKVTDVGDFFDVSSYTFGGFNMSLNQVEHGVMRGIFNHTSVKNAPEATRTQIQKWHQELWGGKTVDSRIHAVVNCAALSCPNLLGQAPFVYDPASLDLQLTSATQKWLDSDKKGAGKDGISMLFSWYKVDFDNSHGSVDNFIKAYRTNGLTGVDSSRSLTYDWTLNITP